MRRHFTAILALFILTVTGSTATGEARQGSTSGRSSSVGELVGGKTVYLTIEINREGETTVSITADSELVSRVSFSELVFSALGCRPEQVRVTRDEGEGITSFDARCDLPLQHTFLSRAGKVKLQPLLDLMDKDKDIAGGVSVMMSGYETIYCSPLTNQVTERPAQSICVYIVKNQASSPRILNFQFGYDRAHAFRIGGILGLLILIPIALAFWFRNRARSIPEEARPRLLFAHRRFLVWTATLGMLAWWTAVDVFHADEYAAFLLPSMRWADSSFAEVLPWILLWIPPMFVYFVCLVLSSPLQFLRGTNYSQREIFGRSFWAVARSVIPISILCVAFAEISNSPRIALLLYAAAIVGGRFGVHRFARSYGLELHALTTGELRDRAFALAQIAGTKLNQLYVLPTERMRMANAFAHRAQNIYLTDYLVKNLTKREVDAILAHELAHLQKKHLSRRMTMTFVVVLGITFAVVSTAYWLPRGFPIGPIILGILLLALYFRSRRNEFAADAGALKLTGDGEALITGLAKLTTLNTMPIHWSKFDEKLLTHPSTLRRIKQIARESGIPEERIPYLLNPPAPAQNDVYSIPDTALPAGKLFSSQYKTRVAARYTWTSLLSASLIPGAVAYAAQAGDSTGTIWWTIYLVGFVLTIAAETIVARFYSRRLLPKLELRLREKFEAQRGMPASSGIFVGLSPDSSPRIYEGDWNWDIGYLSVSSDKLFYWGEEVRFALDRAGITTFSIGPGSVSWFDDSSLYVSWRDAGGHESTFIVRPLRHYSPVTLKQELEDWHLRIPLGADSRLTAIQSNSAPVAAPKFGDVTSVSPRKLVSRQALLRELMINVFVALATSFVLGLYFPHIDYLSGPSGSAYLNPVGGAVYVLIVALLTRVFLLAPFFRIKGAKASDGTTLVSPAPAK